MPRYMNEEATRLYRVIVTTEWKREGEENRLLTQVYGSYNALGSAKAQLNRHVKSDDWYSYGKIGRKTTGRVEYTDVDWKEIDG